VPPQRVWHDLFGRVDQEGEILIGVLEEERGAVDDRSVIAPKPFGKLLESAGMLGALKRSQLGGRRARETGLGQWGACRLMEAGTAAAGDG
jgi:hypothetical protein